MKFWSVQSDAMEGWLGPISVLSASRTAISDPVQRGTVYAMHSTWYFVRRKFDKGAGVHTATQKQWSERIDSSFCQHQPRAGSGSDGGGHNRQNESNESSCEPAATDGRKRGTSASFFIATSVSNDKHAQHPVFSEIERWAAVRWRWTSFMISGVVSSTRKTRWIGTSSAQCTNALVSRFERFQNSRYRPNDCAVGFVKAVFPARTPRARL